MRQIAPMIMNCDITGLESQKDQGLLHCGLLLAVSDEGLSLIDIAIAGRNSDILALLAIVTIKAKDLPNTYRLLQAGANLAFFDNHKKTFVDYAVAHYDAIKGALSTNPYKNQSRELVQQQLKKLAPLPQLLSFADYFAKNKAMTQLKQIQQQILARGQLTVVFNFLL